MAGMAAAMVVALLHVWPAVAAQRDVSIQGNSFMPSSVTIAVNDSVKWTNNEIATDHNVYSDETPQLRSSENLDPGDTYTFTFGAAGTYNYYCTIHGKNVMSGVVVVQAPATTTPPTVAPVTTTRAPATTARPTTTARVSSTSSSTPTTETLALETTTTEDSTTTTTGGDIAIETDDDGGNGAVIAALVVAILGVLGGGAYAIYRLRSGGV